MRSRRGISKPLIYKYFPRLADLFKTLVDREYRYLRGRGLNILPRNAGYVEVIHRSNLRAMEYLYERGPIMRLLASDRSIAGLAKRQDRDERGVIAEYFAKRCMEEYGLPRDVAAVCSILTVNAPILSIRALRRSGIAAHRAAEIWSEFIVGGNYAMQLKYGRRKSAKSNRRRSARSPPSVKSWRKCPWIELPAPLGLTCRAHNYNLSLITVLRERP